MKKSKRMVSCFLLIMLLSNICISYAQKENEYSFLQDTVLDAAFLGGMSPRAMASYGDYLYVAADTSSEANSGLKVVDISNPYEPTLVEQPNAALNGLYFHTNDMSDTGIHIDEVNGYLYVGDSSTSTQSGVSRQTRRFSLEDPAHPVLNGLFPNASDMRAGLNGFATYENWLFTTSQSRIAAFDITEATADNSVSNIKRFSNYVHDIIVCDDTAFFTYTTKLYAVDLTEIAPNATRWTAGNTDFSYATLVADFGGTYDNTTSAYTKFTRLERDGNWLYYANRHQEKIWRINIGDGITANESYEEIYAAADGDHMNGFTVHDDVVYVYVNKNTIHYWEPGTTTGRQVLTGTFDGDWAELEVAQNLLLVRSNWKIHAIVMAHNMVSYENVDDIRSSDATEIFVTAQNSTNEPITAKIITAVYENNGGRLLSTTVGETEVEANSSKQISVNILDDPVIAKREPLSHVKIFVWDGFTNLIPMSEATSLTFNNCIPITRLTYYNAIIDELAIHPISYNGVYSDVADTLWYADKVQALYEYGFLGDSNELNPHTEMTQGMFAEELCLASKLCGLANETVNAEDFMVEYGFIEDYQAEAMLTHGTFVLALENFKNFLEEENYDVSEMPWYDEPIIFRSTDEVATGETFSLFGEELDYAQSIRLTSTTEEEVLSLPILQKDSEGQFVTTILPENASGGVYQASVITDQGNSNEIFLNQARPFWVADSDVLVQGGNARITGTNLMNSIVKLVSQNSGSEHMATMIATEPYMAEFVVPSNMPIGMCSISVSADNGTTWMTLDNEQAISIVESFDDPYDLDVGWAKNYNFTNSKNVMDYGARGDGITDDTGAFAQAVRAVYDDGGGVVYVPEGEYLIQSLGLMDKVIIAGESITGSVLVYQKEASGKTRQNFIYSDANRGASGYQGLYNLTIEAEEGVTAADDYCTYFMKIGEGSSGNSQFEGFFFKNITVDMPKDVENMTRNGQVSGPMWSYLTLNKYCLVDNCTFVGFKGGFAPVWGDYVTMRNCTTEAVKSSWSARSCYVVFEDNDIEYDNLALGGQDNDLGFYSQGFFASSHFYAANNNFENVGTPHWTQKDGATGAYSGSNDGEIICAEPVDLGHVRKAGTIYGVNGLEVTLSPRMYHPMLTENGIDPLVDAEGNIVYSQNMLPEEYISGTNNDGTPNWGDYYLLIVGGRGLGQYRRVTVLNDDTAPYRVTIDKEWDIVPDETSEFLLTTLNAQSIMYNNTATNAQKGYWLYGGGVDCIIANNTGNDVDGIYVAAFDVVQGNHCRTQGTATPVIETNHRRFKNFFITIKDNNFVGDHPQRQTCSIAIWNIYAQVTEPFGYGSYGGVIKGNSMQDANQEKVSVNDPPESQAIYGVAIGSSATFSEDYKVAKGFIVENNSFTNMLSGISIGECRNTSSNDGSISGVVLKENTFDNVGSSTQVRQSCMDVLNLSTEE